MTEAEKEAANEAKSEVAEETKEKPFFGIRQDTKSLNFNFKRELLFESNLGDTPLLRECSISSMIIRRYFPSIMEI